MGIYVFHSEQPRAIVWDSAENKMLCRFKDGVCETADEATAAKLRALGYHEGGEGMALTELSKQQAQQQAMMGQPMPSPPIPPLPEEQYSANVEIGTKKSGRPRKFVDGEVGNE